MIRESLRANRGALLYLICFVFGVSLFIQVIDFIDDPELRRFVPPFIAGVNINFNDHLGWEYYNIASSIVRGDGFGDPFQLDTGPTAWMPPLYCFFLALLLWMLGQHAYVALAVVFLKNLLLVAVGMILCEDSRKSASGMPWLRLLLYSVWLLVFSRWFFMLTHDCWFVMLFVVANYLLAVRLWTRPVGVRTSLGWGLLGGLTSLTQPVLAFVWLLITALAFIRGAERKPERKILAMSLLPFLLLNGVWVARNYATFDRVIWVKSNFFYDFHQANFRPNSGLFAEGTSHPVGQDREGPYAQLGEIEFMDGYRRDVIEGFRDRLPDYGMRVFNRFQAAFLIYPPYFQWFEERFLRAKQLLYSLPFFGLVIVLMLYDTRLPPRMGLAIAIYVGFLLPYVLVSYYIRYAIPLVLLQVLFCAWAVEGLRDWATRREAKVD